MPSQMKTASLGVIAFTFLAGGAGVGGIVGQARGQSLATDPLASMRGSASFVDPFARLESAVYAPGTIGGPGFSATDWVFAYQLFASSTISQLDLAFALGGGGSDASFNPAYGVPGGATPTVTNPLGGPGVDAGLRAIFSPALLNNQRSVVFWFTSTSRPGTGIGGLNGEPFSAWQGTIVAPVPAPGALSVLLLGAVIAGARRRR